MFRRLLLLATVHAALLALNPPWLVIDWSDPFRWVVSTPPEEAVAAAVRVVAIGLTGTQLAALGALFAARFVGSGRLERAARRALLPVFRVGAPIALMASTALPVAAMETRIPIVPPPAATPEVIVTEGALAAVTVRPGDSMWTIAAERVDGDPSGYWRRLVDLNEDRFRDVNLIHPGETVLLPPVSRPG